MARGEIIFSTVVRNASITASVRLPEFRVPPGAEVDIRPLPDNTGVVTLNTDPAIVGAAVGAASIRLSKTDLSVTPPTSNLANLFLAVASANDGVQVLIFKSAEELLTKGTQAAPGGSGGGGGGGGVGGGGHPVL